MKIGRLGGAIMALTIGSASHEAHATTWQVNCSGFPDTTITVGATTVNFGTEVGLTSPSVLTGSGAGAGQPDALGALLGTPLQGTEPLIQTDFSTTLSSGDTVEVSGICNQAVQIRQSAITIAGPSGPIAIPNSIPAFVPIQGDSSQIIVAGAHGVVFNDFLFGNSTQEGDLLATGFPYAGESLLTVADGAEVFLQDVTVADSPTRGIFVRNSAVDLQSSVVEFNGIGNTDQTKNMGIFAVDASAVYLGKSVSAGTSAGANPTGVNNNTGDGVRLANGSTLEFRAGSINTNGQTAYGKQLFLTTSSSAVISGNNAFVANGNTALTAISAPTNNADATVALNAGSSLFLEAQAAVTGGITGTAISASGSSTVLLQGSFISRGVTTVEVTGGSLLALAGGNYICNTTFASTSSPAPGCTLPGGYPNSDSAIEIDHVGALYDLGAIADFNFTAAADTVTGNGVLQLQSTADLGAGLVSGNPSLVWTTGAGGINVSQNSSLRMEGGVAITGSVSLAQGSNGFVNAAKSPGTPNTIAGSIYCPFANVAASHLSISGTTLTVTPIAPTLATSYATASPTGSAGPGGAGTQGTCLTF